MDDLTVMYALLAASIVGLGGLFVFMRRRWAKWEGVLNQVARELGGRYRKGHNNGLAASPGSVEAKIDGRDVTLETATTHVGPSGDSHEVKWMAISISTSSGKPEFFGPPESNPDKSEVVDYSDRGGGSETVEVGGYRIPAGKLPKRLRKQLDGDPEAKRLLADHFAAGGYLDHGNVVLRTRKFERDPGRLVQRIRDMSAIAAMIG